MKRILLSIAILVSATTKAQVISVSLQASGLTCSMCSNAINKALKSLDFVQRVDADIKTYHFEISFKPNADIDFDLIRKRVENAGFKVSGFVANIHFNNVRIKNGQPVLIQDKTFLFLNSKDEVLDGNRQIKILDKGFISEKEYKKTAIAVLSPLTYHVTL